MGNKWGVHCRLPMHHSRHEISMHDDSRQGWGGRGTSAYVLLLLMCLSGNENLLPCFSSLALNKAWFLSACEIRRRTRRPTWVVLGMHDWHRQPSRQQR